MKKTYVLIGIVTLVLLLSLNFFRLQANDGVEIGFRSFYEKRHDIITNGLTDALTQKPITFTPNLFVHSLVSKSIPPWIVWSILSTIVALLVWHLFEKNKLDELSASIALALIILSPAFLAGTIANAGIILATLIFLLFILYPQLRYLTAIVIPFFGVEWFAVAIIFLVLFSWSWIIASILSVSVVVYIIVLYITQTAFVFEIVTFSQFFADFGGLYGLTLFTIAFFLIGFFVLWEKTYKKHYFFILSTIVLSFFNQQVLLIATIGMSIFAAIIIEKIVERKWESNTLHILQIIFIFVALFATCFFVAQRTMHTSPTLDEIQIQRYLATQPFGVVLTHESNGFYTEYLGEKPAFPNPNLYAKDYKIQKQQSNLLFNTSKLSDAVIALNSYNISYILVSPSMLTGDVWNFDLDGLLLPLQSQRVFTKLYEENGYILYKINYENAQEELSLASKSE